MKQLSFGMVWVKLGTLLLFMGLLFYHSNIGMPMIWASIVIFFIYITVPHFFLFAYYGIRYLYLCIKYSIGR